MAFILLSGLTTIGSFVFLLADGVFDYWSFSLGLSTSVFLISVLDKFVFKSETENLVTQSQDPGTGATS